MTTHKLVSTKTEDFLERVGWTFIQAELGLGALDLISKGINLSLLHTLYASLGAAVAATVKVLLAQRLGGSDSGSLPDTTAAAKVTKRAVKPKPPAAAKP